MDESRSVRKRHWRRLLFLLIPALAGLFWYGSGAVGYVANHRAYMVPLGSMGPAILPGDRITVDIGADAPKRGEIWAINGPGSTLIKRVIGLPGETIEIGGGQVLIDGKPLPEPYLASPTTSTMPPVHLGPGQYFLMGDSRATSADSRVWGPVHESKFVGRADYRYWPSNRMGPLR